MKRTNLKLSLSRETIRTLGAKELGVVGGGGTELCPATNFCPLNTAGCTRDKCPDPTPTAGCDTHS